MRVLCILVALLLPTVAFSQTTIAGYDVLGLAKYCDTFLKAPKLPAVSVLMRSFGDPLPCLRRRIAMGGITTVQFDLRDATCWRNNACPKGTPRLTDWNDISNLANRVNRFIQNTPEKDSIAWYVSPYLEHDFKDRQTIVQACNVITKACPTCKCVNSPFSGTRSTGFPLELHGTKVSAWSVSGDGASIFDGDNLLNDAPNKPNGFQHRLSGSFTTFGWADSFNLRCQGMKSFVAIDKRTYRPTLEHFEQMYRILTSVEDIRPPAPAACQRVREVQGKEIVKTNAEKYCNGQGNENDPRGDKLLLIINKGKGPDAPILASNGKQVGCLRYFGTFEGGGHRWYIGTCSRETPMQLYKKLGNEWGFARFGNECIRFNSIRRQGVYR